MAGTQRRTGTRVPGVARDPRPRWRWLAALARGGLLAVALGWASAGEATPPAPAPPPVPAADDGLEQAPQIPLWPLLESSTKPDGSHHAWVLGLWHRVRERDGRTRSQHVLNVLWWRSGHAVLPFWWRWGPEGARRTVAAPVYAGGPGWWAAPLLLSGSWKERTGGRTTWITPLHHRTTDARGRVAHAHLLTALWNADRWAVLPVAWGGRGRINVMPAWFSGDGWWFAPPLLSGSLRGRDGRTTWVTPLFHRSTDAQGRLRHQHIGPWLQGQERMGLLPIAWRTPSSSGLLPVWISGRHWWTIPVGLTASWRNRDGSRTTVVGPLAHWRSDADGGVRSAHVLTYVRTRDTHLLLPLAWHHDRTGRATWGVLPLAMKGHHWWAAPVLLSGGRHRPETSTLWLTPLFHRHRDGARSSLHLATWFSGREGDRGYRALAPLFWSSWEGERRRTAFVPAFFATERTLVVPAALSGWRRHGDGGGSWWLTPLAHVRTTADGALRDAHVGPWFTGRRADGRGYDVLAPIAYRVTRPDRRHYGVIPAWFAGRDYAVAPPLLSGWIRRRDGSESLWLTPLAHRTTDAQGRTVSVHAGPWYRHGDHQGVLPFWFRGHDWQAVPAALSFWRRRGDGGDSLWVTPLFHRDRDAAGAVRSWHAGPWLSHGDRQALLPVWFARGRGEDRRWALVPLLWRKRDAWIAPLALSAHRRGPAGGSTWLTPLVHWRRDANGSLARMHAGLWWQDRDTRALVPFWAQGRDWWVAPPLLSAGLPRGNGGRSTWFTPLAHLDRDAAGRIDGGHLLTWFHGRDHDVVFPLWWRIGRHRALLPFVYHGPRATVVPPLLSGQWRHADGGESTWFTPLAHRTRGADGRLRDWHVLNVARSGRTTTVLPLAWSRAGDDGRRTVVLPCWYSAPGTRVLAPVFWSFRSGERMAVVPFWFTGRDTWAAPLLLSAGWTREGRTTAIITPLFHRSARAGRTESLHALTYVRAGGFRAAAPLWWSWRDEGQHRTLGIPLWYRRSGGGSATTVVLPALFAHHRGRELSPSLALQLAPFLVQRAPDASEVNILWRLWHRRAVGDTSEVMVGPFWSSEHRTGRPMRWNILGGLVSRRSNWDSGRYRYYLLWVIPLNGGRSAVPPPAAPVLPATVL